MPAKTRLTKRFRERKTIQTYTPTIANELAMPLTITQMGKSAGFASGPRGRKVLFCVDPHDSKKVWLGSRGIEYGWTLNR